MTPRQLGPSDLHLTPVGLGTWAMGGGNWKASWGPQDDDASVATIHAALDGGINWIDTAPVYGLGHAEDVVGRALKSWSGAKPLVATKCGRAWRADRRDVIDPVLNGDAILTECEASLRRLGVDTLDLYQIHWPKPDEKIEEAWGAIAQLVSQGKVRHAGVSNFSVAQLERVGAIHPVTSLQPQYNLLQRQIEADVLPHCRAQNIGVVSYSTMAKGLLTGKVTADWVQALPPDDHRRRDGLYQPEAMAGFAAPLKAFESLAADKGISPAQLAVAWSFHQPGLTSAIAGARRPDQIAPLAAAMHTTLTEAELGLLDALFPTPTV